MEVLKALHPVRFEYKDSGDAHIGFIAFGWVTMGMLLTLTMIALGLFFIAWSRNKPVDAKV